MMQSDPNGHRRGFSAATEIRAALSAMFSIPRASKRKDIVGYRRAKRRNWTAKHIRMLKTLAKKRRPAASIARTLKRTEGAVRQKAFSLGLSLETRAVRQTPNYIRGWDGDKLGLEAEPINMRRRQSGVIDVMRLSLVSRSEYTADLQ
jgi:hypothetical protein